MRKRRRIRQQKTPFDIKAKKLSRLLSNTKKHPIYQTTWAGFRCPQCQDESAEGYEFIFGGCALKCYSCGFYTEFVNMQQLRRATHSKINN